MLFHRTSALLLVDISEQAVTNRLCTFGTMPYHDEEYPGQPLWQSVLLFCCKGMIEGIMVILFFWLLVQVLFTKQLEVHLQILLLVGLVVFCLTLILGCIICCKKSQLCSGDDKASVTSAPVEPVTSAQTRHSSGTTTASRQLYRELEGDPSEYPSTFTSPAPSQDEFLPGLFSDRAQPACEENQQATACFSPCRFSSPLQTAPLYIPIHPGRASLPSLPKLGLLTKTCKALQRRCSVTGDNRSDNEHSRLTRHKISSVVTPGNSIPLVPLNYGSNASFKPSSKPCLHFTMAFSAERQTLAVTVLNLTGMPQGLEGLTVLGSLPPLHTSPTPVTLWSGHGTNGLLLFLNVSSEEELQSCELRLAVYKQKTQWAKWPTLGEVEVQCGGRAWSSEHPFHLVKELTHKNQKVEQSLQSLSSQDALACQGLSCSPQIYIGLQYQELNHCIKTSILRAENLDYLTSSSSSSSSSSSEAADYQVVINLHHEGVLISSRETPPESCTVCSASFLFHLPPGDISQLPVLLEFLIVQSGAVSEGRVVGRVLLGAEAAEAGRAHWTDMVSLQEQARWHIIQSETLHHMGAE